MSPSSRVTVKGMGRIAHATPAIAAVTPTPCGMNVKNYPQNYPHWDIAFAQVSDYTDSLEDLLSSAPLRGAVSTQFQKTLGLNDFYFGMEGLAYPMGTIQMVGKSVGK